MTGGAVPSAVATRSARPRNSISPSQGSSTSGSGSRTASASSGSSSGTSRRSVTRSREMRICSAWPSSTSRRFGCLISAARSSSVSRSPYSWISCAAVLTPMPGAPGTLSTESPASACTSITRSGPTPNFSNTSSGPIGLFFSVSNISTPGATSCIRSLSADDDRHPPAERRGLRGVGGDDVVGLEPRLLEAGQVEGAGRVADQPELRHEILGRRRALRPCRPGRARCGRSPRTCRR